MSTSANISTNLNCAIWQVNSYMKGKIIIMCWNVSENAFGQDRFLGYINLCYFRDALHNTSTGLAYEALTGKQKQSVPHCEEIFSRGELEFMQRNGHATQAKFIETVWNWHKAADGRGPSEQTRSQCNKDMLSFLLED